MLLNNFIATMYPNMETTDTTGKITEETRFNNSIIITIPSNFYAGTSETTYFNPFGRGIAFGSGTTPPRKQIIN